MMKMDEPSMTYDQVFQACKDGISRGTILDRLNESKNALYAHSDSYRIHGMAATLYTLLPTSGADPVVAKSLTKKDLIKLYESYFRDKEPGRALYEVLLASANEDCPFCGGIGYPRNLDHFMPKARFSQFAILPLNLIPSCRDCNMDGKGQAFCETEEGQILHPYLDAPHFFEQQWVFARYLIESNGEPNTIQYYVDPPADWNDVDKARVRQHFLDFDIAKRYAKQASSALTEVEAQRKAFLLSDTIESFKQIVLKPVIELSPFINHWKRIMYLAIINDI